METNLTTHTRKPGITWCCETLQYLDANGNPTEDVNESTTEAVTIPDPPKSLEQRIAELEAQLNP